MTEKQGGTDVRANTTHGGGRRRRLCDHRPQMVHVGADVRRVPGAGAGARRADLFPDAALSSGRQLNGLRFQRLKDKLGNRSNASSEVEFADAFAWRVGEEGSGVRTIIEMVQLTRLDCAIASAGLMRMALAQAAASRPPSHRVPEAARRPADDAHACSPTWRSEVEGVARALVMRLCPRLRPRRRAMPAEAARARLLTPAVKYWVCKTAPGFHLRGDGVPWRQRLCRGQHRSPRLYREAPRQRHLGRRRAT